MSGTTARDAPECLFAVLAAHARQQGDALALVAAEGHLSYAALHARVQHTAHWLRQRGIRRGDRVAVWLVNRAEWLVLLLACASLGAGVVAINTRYRAHEVAHLLTRSRARLLFLRWQFRQIDFRAILASADPAWRGHVECLVTPDADTRHLPDAFAGGMVVACFDPMAPGDAVAAAEEGRPEDTLAYFTTSGTTSAPKLVAHSQRNMVAHSRRVAATCGIDADAALLLVLPLCGVFGMNAALAFLVAGRPILMPETFDAGDTLRLLRTHRPTHIFGSDDMYARLLPAAQGSDDFRSLRVAGFASFSPQAAATAQAALAAGLPMRGLYGSSELQALFAMQAAAAPVAERLLPGGLPADPGTAVRCVDVDTGALVSPGVPGQLEVRSPRAFDAYFEQPTAYRDAFTPDGYFRTGDIGYTRPDGSFVFQARAGDAMRLGGFLVAPSEIEEALMQEPGIREAQVVPLETAGTVRAVAFVLAGVAFDEARTLQRLSSRMAPFKVPARIWVLQEFPLADGPNGLKVQKHRLRELAAQRALDAATVRQSGAPL